MRILVRCAALIAVGMALVQTAPAQADDYPSRSVTMIVPWAPAGAVDTTARIVAPKLAERLGKPVVVENRGGAGSTLGTAIAAKAAPDGYTLGMPGSGSMAVGPAMYKTLPYDPTKDFAPMALIGRVPFVLVVNASLPVKTIPELIRYAKDNKMFYGSGGPGSPHHIYAEMFKGMTGIEMTHVPYKGSADAIKDLVAGHVQIMFSDSVPSVPLIAAGAIRALGVTTLARWTVAPDIPPLNEAGVPGFDAAGWFMVSGPAGTPKPIVERLHTEFKTILGLPDVLQAVSRTGVVPVVSPPLDELPKFIASEKDRWGKVVQQAGLAGTL
ncbi:MAG: tripartite tricarboxylate transporter substrate binding protein [Xanthobacteraceae bacterium]|nr:tripartite tricarboxylate transporter substrate binding protein [Xanthobacteraceae bacterium]